MLSGESDDQVGFVNVRVPELGAAVAGRGDVEARQRLPGPPAHRHPFDDMGPRGGDLDVIEMRGEDGTGHHRPGGVAGADEDDVGHLSEGS